MRTTVKIVMVIALATLTTITSLQAAAPASRTAVTPGQINYQGRLTTPSGALYSNTTYNIEFRVYDADSGGAVQWGAKYLVYAKNGYFNVLLGASGGQALTVNTPVYGPEELWKALWYDVARANNNNLFLGITVLEDYTGAALPADEVSEAFPRQKLLCTPFAERAQSARYARESFGAFSAGGDLDVTGSVAATGNLAVDGNSSVDGTATVQGTTTFNSGVVVNNAVADLNKGLDVNGGRTYLRQGLDVFGSSELRGGATVTGPVTASDTINAPRFQVNGAVPIHVRRFDCGTGEDQKTNTGYSTTDWSAMMVGFDMGYGDIDEDGGEETFKVRMYESGGTWWIHCQGHYHGNYADFGIDVMFVKRALVDDNRY
ncbi:MAG: hypothetical protein HN919_06820 [Verrucomicrobia bacterium]|jgi:hypothetical protein|nr:hypothetical protein [Verrucomicrobiota bacterium]MBT7065996.1 hypothetical protein [Verrucomicrobiota bacterium]MBT7699327.1 hypothetical protein [Verrucomicrobiota bacterium]